MAEHRDAYEILQVHPSALPEVVEAAYRALALVHHPDRNGNRDSGAMAELNWAYGILHDPERRMAYDRTRVPIPVGEPAPPAAQPAVGSSLRDRMARTVGAAAAGTSGGPAGVVLDSGRYAGMTLGELVRIDPAYLEWLRRHTSGLRYRHAIGEVLTAHASRRAAMAAAAEEQRT